MEYNKPAINAIEDAVAVIQGMKWLGASDSPPAPIHTTAAYEVDE